MKKLIPALLLLCMMQKAMAQTNPKVGGAVMESGKDAIENLSKSADHTVFITLINKSGIVNTIKGSGPFTIFAPTNAAFAKLPKGTIESWLKPENRATLVQLISYHLVAGKIDTDAMDRLIREGGSTARLKTVAGGMLTLRLAGDKLSVIDEAGEVSVITTKNISQTNGIIQVIDGVLRPAS